MKAFETSLETLENYTKMNKRPLVPYAKETAVTGMIPVNDALMAIVSEYKAKYDELRK